MKQTSLDELKELFVNLGVTRGKIVMLHGFIPSLGKLDSGYDTLFDTLFELVGEEGGVIVPTFTYSFTKGEVFDVNNSKSTVGDFTNYFLTLDSCYRNLEPNFSMAGVGKNIKQILVRDKRLTFGRNSMYEKIEEADVLFLLLGINWDQGLSYFMHLEASYGVDYRYNKVFNGKIINYSEDILDDEAVHFVRDLDMNPIQYRTRIGKYLEKKGIANVVKFGYGVHRSIGAKTLKKEVFKKLDFNKNYLLKEINNEAINVM